MPSLAHVHRAAPKPLGGASPAYRSPAPPSSLHTSLPTRTPMPSHIKRALESPAANYANTKDAGANGHTADDQQEDADAGGGMDFDDDGGGVDGQDDEHEHGLGGEGGGDEVMEDGEAHGTAEKGRGSGKEVKPELGHTNGAPAALA
eukprot:scaffold29546_cov20-Tisochrysis_lutea.AAC.3